MKFVEHKLATGAMLTGYLRDETTEMPSYNTRPAVLIPAAVATADRSRVRHPVPAPECGGPAHCGG